jgi:hypothetical protein
MTEASERATAGPSAAEIDATAAAAATVEQLKAKRLSQVDRIEVNRRASAALAFDAFTNGGKARQEVDDYDSELAKLQRELSHIDAAIAEAERRHHTALKAEEAEATQARDRQVLALFDRLVTVYEHVDAVLAVLANDMHAAAEVELMIVQSGCGYPPSGAPNLQERLRLATVLHHEFPAGWARFFENRPPDKMGGRPPVDALGPIARGWRETIGRRLGVELEAPPVAAE